MAAAVEGVKTGVVEVKAAVVMGAVAVVVAVVVKVVLAGEEAKEAMEAVTAAEAPRVVDCATWSAPLWAPAWAPSLELLVPVAQVRRW